MNTFPPRKILITALAVWSAAVFLSVPRPAAGQDGKALSLEEAIRTALAANEASLSADQDLVQANAALTRARAYFLPTVSVSGTYTRRPFEAVRIIGGIQTVIQSYNALSGAANLSMILFDSHSIPTLRQAKLDRMAELFGTADASGRWPSRSATPSWRRSSVDQVLEASRTPARLRQADPGRGQGPLRGRAWSRSTTSPGPSSNTRPPSMGSTQAQGQVETTYLELGYLLNSPPPAKLVSARLPAQGGGPSPSARRRLIQRSARPAARRQVAPLAGQGSTRPRSRTAPQWLPSLTLTGQYSYTNEAGLTGKNFNWNVGVTMSWCHLRRLHPQRRLSANGSRSPIRPTWMSRRPSGKWSSTSATPSSRWKAAGRPEAGHGRPTTSPRRTPPRPPSSTGRDSARPCRSRTPTSACSKPKSASSRPATAWASPISTLRPPSAWTPLGKEPTIENTKPLAAVLFLGLSAVALLAFRPAKKAAISGRRPPRSRGGNRGTKVVTHFPSRSRPSAVRSLIYTVNAVGSVDAFEKVQVTARVVGRRRPGPVRRGQHGRRRPDPRRDRARALSSWPSNRPRPPTTRPWPRRPTPRPASSGAKPSSPRTPASSPAKSSRPGGPRSSWRPPTSPRPRPRSTRPSSTCTTPMSGRRSTASSRPGPSRPGNTSRSGRSWPRSSAAIRCSSGSASPSATRPSCGPGQAANFKVRDNEKEYAAKIVHVAAAADEGTRMVAVTAEIRDTNDIGPPARRLRRDHHPGQRAARSARSSPRRPSGPSERGFIAYVVENDIAVERILTIGMRTADGQAEVLSGLKPGEMLVVRGAEALRNGAPVRVVKPGRMPAAGQAAKPAPIRSKK